MNRRKTKDETLALWEGPVAYARRVRESYEIIVYSTNCVVHKPAGKTDDPARAESVCRRLNAYPRQTRAAFDLL